jgi:UDP-N-acetyl-D-mannosaminuronate dehydrogenase
MAGDDVHLGCDPERIDPGSGQRRFENTPKVVLGTEEASLEAVKDFYDTLVAPSVPKGGPARVPT